MALTDGHDEGAELVRRMNQLRIVSIIRKGLGFSDGSQFNINNVGVNQAIIDSFRFNVLIVTKRDGNDEDIALPHEALLNLKMMPTWVNEGTPFNSEWNDSNMYALVIPQPVAHCPGGSSSTGTMLPCLYLDSGATVHVVGDNRFLTNLHDPFSGMAITVANGTQLAIAKVGDIQTQDITIRDVRYVPGLKMNLISVRQLAKSKIVTIFYENHAELWLEEARIGGGILDDTVGLYKLRYLHERS